MEGAIGLTAYAPDGSSSEAVKVAAGERADFTIARRGSLRGKLRGSSAGTCAVELRSVEASPLLIGRCARTETSSGAFDFEKLAPDSTRSRHTVTSAGRATTTIRPGEVKPIAIE